MNIDTIKKYYPFIMFIAIIVLSLLLFQTRSTLKQERKMRKYQMEQDAQNISTLKDSIISTFNKKLNAYEFEKDNYVVQKLADLEKYNKSLTEELKKVKGDVIAAIKTDAIIDLGTVTVDNNLEVLDSNLYGLKFDSQYKDGGFEQHIAGTSKFYMIPNNTTNKWELKPDSTFFDINTSRINVTYGFKEEDDAYKVFAISKSPKIIFDDLTGGYIIKKQPIPAPKKPKKWGIGPYAGYGVNTGSDGNVRFGWSVGISIHYDIFQW